MAKDSSNRRKTQAPGCLKIMLVVVGIAGIATLLTKKESLPAPQTAADKAVKERTEGDNAMLYVAQRAIRDGMKDPASAEFFGGFGRLKHGQRVACGEVNGKNSFGAFAGNQP